MHVFCSICREAFSPVSEVNATPCGHLYHVNCLDKWSEEKTTCPQCRSHIWQRAQHVEFLFREIPNEQENSSDYKQLQCDYEVIRQEEITLRTKYKELKSLQVQLKQKLSECKTDIKNSEYDIVIWEKQCTVYDQVEDIRAKLLKQNKDMVERNNLLNKLNKLINGTEAEMYEVLSLMPANEYTIRELCTFVQAMKYKLKKNENYYKKELKKIISFHEEDVHEAFRQKIKKEENEGKRFVDKAIQTEPKQLKILKKNY